MGKGSRLVQGTLDLLILRSLRAGQRHGYGVLSWLKESSGEDLKIEEGALYPGLHRLEARGLIASEWGLSENNRRARFYKLTSEGRRQLQTDTASWQRYVAMVSRVLEAAG